MKTNIKRITICGLLSAIGYVSLWFIRIPIIPTATFLRFDIKDVFIAFMGILYGPIYAFAGAVCVSLLQILSISEYGAIGLIMNILSVSTFTIPIALAYKWKKNNIGLLVGFVIGTISVVISMLLWNYLITPLYMGVPRDIVRGMILPVFLPFNTIKGIINSVLIFILYNSLQKIISLEINKYKEDSF